MENREIHEEQVRRANLEFYNRTAGEYSIHEPVVFPWKSHLRVESALRTISRRCGAGRALEVGCGLGFVTRYVERFFSAVWGIDLSREMARLAAGEGHRVVVADGSRLPFAGGIFDAVVCYSVLHHFYDYGGVIRESSRVLKKGGYIFIDWDPNVGFTTTLAAKLYRGVSKAYVRFKGALGLLDGESMKPTREPTDFGEEIDRLAEIAEYHHHCTKGIDPAGLTDALEEAGFGEIELYFHDDYLSLWWGMNRDLPLRLLGFLIALITLRRRPSYLKWLAVIARKS